MTDPESKPATGPAPRNYNRLHIAFEMEKLVPDLDVFLALEKEIALHPLPDGSSRTPTQVHQTAMLLFAEYAGHGLLGNLEGVIETLRDHLLTVAQALPEMAAG